MRFFVVMLLLAAANVNAAEMIYKQSAPVSGAQLFVMDPVYNGNADRFFEEAAEKGIDTVFFRVFHNAGDRTHMGLPNPCSNGGVYFASRNACVVSDLLPTVVAAGHAKGIKVYAWMATRSLSFLKTDNLMSQKFIPHGTAPGYGANIFIPEVRTTIKNLFMELAESEADGILIQDDFIMKYNEGADWRACGAFTRDTGIPCDERTLFSFTANKTLGTNTEAYPKWAAWKSKQLQDFLYEVRSEARLINPKQKWAVNIYYETPVYPDRGLSWYAQDIHGIWNTGVDYLAVMVYQEQIMKELNLTKWQFLDFAETLAKNTVADAGPGAAGAIFKIQVKLFDSKHTAVSDADLKLLCGRLKRAGGVSFVQLPIDKPGDLTEVCK